MNFIKNSKALGVIPVFVYYNMNGHLNKSTSISPYTHQPFPNLKNIQGSYEDSSTTFFFGDTFIPSSKEHDYWAKDDWKTGTVLKNGDSITWTPKLKNLKDYGVNCILIGPGVGISTGCGTLARESKPDDDYFLISKIKNQI